MKSPIVPALLGFAAGAVAQISQSTLDDIVYQINIPEATAQSGNGDIFLQIKAPTSYTWVALGQGDQMAGSQIFVMYSSSDGNNVTVSPRIATGYIMPQYNSDAQIEILEGTGIKDGMMTANFKCSSCNSWDGGTMDFADDQADWVHAAKSGAPLNMDSPSARIAKHDTGTEASFSWNMATGRGGNSVNPFVEFKPPAASDNSATNMGTRTPFSTETLIAHAVLASLAMVVFFPLGAISIRILNFPGLIWFHAGIQLLAYLTYIAAAGLGIHIAMRLDYLHETHPIIGLVILATMFLQPIGGILHHLGFKKSGGRTFWSYIHIWLGRALITLGMINGGLGLQLANNSNAGEIIYAVVAGLLWVSWVAASLYGELKRSKSPPVSEKQSENDKYGRAY